VTLLDDIRGIATTVAVPHHEPPRAVLRRRIVVVVVLVIGGALLGYSLTRQPGDESFFWLTLALAAVWALGAFASGPLHLGSVRFGGRNQRPVITGTVIGLALGGLFVVGGLVAREIPGVREFVVRILDFANHGPLALVVFITVLNGIAEELFFRGALYTALGKAYPAVVSTVIYVIATSATTGNPMLGVASVVVGAVCAFERRSTGGVLAPMLTHFFWGLVMVLALPPVFGV
jgi:membrane protease YdiL (CAAX protease family)